MSDQQPPDTKKWLRKRRSQRIEFSVPVGVHRRREEGPAFNERTETLVVSAHGALMALAGLVAPKQKLLIQNLNSGEQQECRVVSVEKKQSGPPQVAVEFARPAPSFWRIAFPPADWAASV